MAVEARIEQLMGLPEVTGGRKALEKTEALQVVKYLNGARACGCRRAC